MIEESIKKAVAGCLDKNVPFCLYLLPGEDSTPVFFSNPSGKKCLDVGREFLVGCWNERWNDVHSIKEEKGLEETLNLLSYIESQPSPEISPVGENDDYEEYLSKIRLLLHEMKEKNIEKVVFSTNVSCSHDFSSSVWPEIAEKVFSAYTTAFRYLYYTPLTGAWLGASPEMLMDYEPIAGVLKTVALAGTRSHLQFELTEPWDAKDMREQKIVENFILKTLKENSLEVDKIDNLTVRSGDLQHIETRISAKFKFCDKKDIGLLVDELQPTPALSGYPRNEAIKLIEKFEGRPRNCYGGFVGLSSNEGIKLFVNIRCLHFDNKKYCLYGGGGILSESDPDEEHTEAMSKINTLSKFLK